MNFFTRTFLKATDRDLYHKIKLQERDQLFLNKANTGRILFPAHTKPSYSFKHSGNAGDIIYSLPAAFALADNASIELFLNVDHPMNYSVERGKHPLNGVMLNSNMVAMLQPLLLSQSNIKKCAIYQNQSIDYDLDVFRRSPFDTHSGSIARWYFLHFAVNADLGKPWLTVTPDNSFNDYIVIARSLGYHSPGIDYSFLKKYRNLIFVGVPEEFNEMKQVLPAIKYQPVSNFLELAQLIAGCKFFIGNQSFPFSLAEALKVKRILEVYYICPNVIVEGINGYDFCFQEQFERIVSRLQQPQ